MSFRHKTEYEIKVFHPLKIHQYTKFNGPNLTGANFASTT
jgi:hypothetical protein